ncbi:hypothetical protein D9611_013387 [Ephemerocybe angulata]|uniref:F-box domain-containing protein n=1 Tax=Ephemerocybe angulata TaxID=980116 RepID=A0A8H5CBM0_9AGAR|nr:hypothetical protein D9611_013387 [Tulosesus angulatus]
MTIPTAHQLIHVCKHWRNVALDIPDLWKHAILVHTALPDWPEDTTGVQLRARAFHDIAELYGGKLSHVQLSWLWRMPRDSTCAQPNSVLQYMDRYVWFKLVVGDFFSHFTGFYSQLNNNDGKIHAPLLEELCLICYKATIEQEVVEFEAPMLKRLALYDHPMDSTRQFILPWHQLTQLSVGEPRFLNRSASLSSRWRDLTRLLHSLSSLEYLHQGAVGIEILDPGSR